MRRKDIHSPFEQDGTETAERHDGRARANRTYGGFADARQVLSQIAGLQAVGRNEAIDAKPVSFVPLRRLHSHMAEDTRRYPGHDLADIFERDRGPLRAAKRRDDGSRAGPGFGMNDQREIDHAFRPGAARGEQGSTLRAHRFHQAFAGSGGAMHRESR